MADSEIVISAVAYPIGTDPDEATGFLKFTVINHVLQASPQTLGETITRGYLTGKGIQIRSAYRYARDHFSWGLPTAGLTYTPSPDRTPLTNVLKALNPGTEIQYQGLDIGASLATYWGQRYLATKYGYDTDSKTFVTLPAGVHENAAVAFALGNMLPQYDDQKGPMPFTNSAVNDVTIFILFTNPDATTQQIVYYPNRPYPSLQDSPTTPLLSDTLWMNFPSVQARYRTVKTYPATVTQTSRAMLPGEVSHTTSSSVTKMVYGEEQVTTTTINYTVAGGSTTVRTTQQTVVTSRLKYYLYCIATPSNVKGYQPTLASWIHTLNFASPFYPAVPLRVSNQDWTVSSKQSTDLYKTSKKLLKRFGMNIQDLADQLNTNENIDDIDFAFVVFGVPINAKAPECTRYIYEFFKSLVGIDMGVFTDPPYDPDNNDYYHPDMATLHIYHPGREHNNYNVRIRWKYLTLNLREGVVAPGAKPGDCVVDGATTHHTRTFHVQGTDREISEDDSIVYFRKQIDANTYEEIETCGLVHNNYIYGPQWCSTPAWDQLNLDDINGFIVPLNEEVLRSMPLGIVTDLVYHVPQLVLNCYTVVKKKWYQTNWFKYLMIVVAVVITVMSWGADGGASLGYAMAFNALASAGVTGVLLTYLAHALFALAMLIIANIIAKISVAVFGDKWGAVVAAIVMIAVASYANTGSWTAGFTGGATTGTGLSAQMILNATGSVLKVGKAYLAGEMADLQAGVAALESEEKMRMKHIEELVKELNDGRHTDEIDIQGLTDSTFSQFFEDMGTFLDRTLITGSDVADITSGVVANFADIGLQLPNTG